MFSLNNLGVFQSRDSGEEGEPQQSLKQISPVILCLLVELTVTISTARSLLMSGTN